MKLAQLKVTARLCPLACAVAMVICRGSGIPVAHCPHGSGSMTVQGVQSSASEVSLSCVNHDSALR